MACSSLRMSLACTSNSLLFRSITRPLSFWSLSLDSSRRFASCSTSSFNEPLDCGGNRPTSTSLRVMKLWDSAAASRAAPSFSTTSSNGEDSAASAASVISSAFTTLSVTSCTMDSAACFTCNSLVVLRAPSNLSWAASARSWSFESSASKSSGAAFLWASRALWNCVASCWAEFTAFSRFLRTSEEVEVAAAVIIVTFSTSISRLTTFMPKS
mmetsp:Transcript_81840/g.171173  ORF Transcript_81840/g.171173 Transcript_81840/m.171173 type:complete len:213 (-) Transcript_81840:1447-2085(-)